MSWGISIRCHSKYSFRSCIATNTPLNKRIKLSIMNLDFINKSRGVTAVSICTGGMYRIPDPRFQQAAISNIFKTLNQMCSQFSATARHRFCQLNCQSQTQYVNCVDCQLRRTWWASTQYRWHKHPSDLVSGRVNCSDAVVSQRDVRRSLLLEGTGEVLTNLQLTLLETCWLNCKKCEHNVR